MYAKFAGSVLFPLHERLKGHGTGRVLRSLERSQWLGAGELQALQLDKLRVFLSRIERTVPYYRELFEQLSFNPASISSISDLQRLPLMSKPEIREHTKRLRAEGAGDLKQFNTGGSSGEPLIFYLGKERISHDVAAKRRATRWWGVDIGDPEIVVWGSPIELGAQGRLRHIRDALFQTELLPAFEMSDENLDRFVERIRSRKPQMLFGYPSSLSHIANHARSRGIRLDNLGIRVVFVTSESLYEHQRQCIEDVFACPVANGYGGRDAGFIAHQCPSGALHISAEDIIVETVLPDGSPAAPGDSGEIVITHMATAEFPFVRYRMGDIGCLDNQPCPCGRGLPVLGEIEGRTTDFIVAQNGTVMHGLSLIYVMRELPAVREFKIVQETLDWTRVLVIPGSDWDSRQADAIVAGFKQRLGHGVQVDVIETREIPTEQSGKRRYVVSKVGLSTRDRRGRANFRSKERA